MYIKNTLRLFINNLNLGFKAMLYRFIVTIIGLFCAYTIAKFGISVITDSAQMGQFIQDIKSLWLQFLGHDDVVVNIQSSFSELISLFNANLFRIIGSLSAVFLVVFVMDYLLGLCNYTMCVMVSTYMSSLTKTRFTQTFIQNIKKALVFELFYVLVKDVSIIIAVAICACFVVFTYKFLGFLSILIGLWLLITLLAVFYALTSTLRPNVIRGEKIPSAIKNSGIKKSNFFPIFATYILSIVLVIYANVSMCLVTLGAGIMVSIPLSYLFLLCLQNVIEYSINSRKYYIDYDNIVIPKQLRGEDERLLSEEVDI